MPQVVSAKHSWSWNTREILALLQAELHTKSHLLQPQGCGWMAEILGVVDFTSLPLGPRTSPNSVQRVHATMFSWLRPLLPSLFFRPSKELPIMECLCGYAGSEGWGVGEQWAIVTRCILFLLYTWEVGTLPKWGILGEWERIENFLSLKHKVVRNEDGVIIVKKTLRGKAAPCS